MFNSNTTIKSPVIKSEFLTIVGVNINTTMLQNIMMLSISGSDIHIRFKNNSNLSLSGVSVEEYIKLTNYASFNKLSDTFFMTYQLPKVVSYQKVDEGYLVIFEGITSSFVFSESEFVKLNIN